MFKWQIDMQIKGIQDSLNDIGDSIFTKNRKVCDKLKIHAFNLGAIRQNIENNLIDKEQPANGSVAGSQAAPTTQGSKSAPEIVESNYVCQYCVNLPKDSHDCINPNCIEHDEFKGRRLSPIA